MKKNKGFTLVELLAVIVILAIIMIIAIPAVINTMQTARKKTMVEFAQKVLNRIDEIYAEKTAFGDLRLTAAEETIIVFDIKKDLGLSNTGNFHGMAFLSIRTGLNDFNKEVSLFDNEYYLYYSTFDEKDLDTDCVNPNYYIKTMKESGFTLDNFPYKEMQMYYHLHTIENWFSIGVIDAATGEQKGEINTQNDGSYDSEGNLIAEDNDDDMKLEFIKKYKKGDDIFA